MIGRTLGHYCVTRQLGKGGMGVVYLAQDTKLNRQVALKVLPVDVASDASRRARFEREARAVAALNHPNIVTIYSVEKAVIDAGQSTVHFITMELVEGRTLADLTPRDGLPLESFLAVAIPLADALASAHARGIVHRDLKPSNVMVTDEGGRVKILDFGLAKALDRIAENTDQGEDSAERQRMGEAATVTSPDLTAFGTVLGTAAYMSPEQVRGGAVDHRTDIFSLGVVLYELATGARPFRGTSAIELMSAILKDPVPSVRAARADLPPQLGQVLERCLEKAPADRYQTAGEASDALRALQQKAATEPSSRPTTSGDVLRRSQAEAPWIAVMPFDCQADDAELRNVAAGLTEDLTTSLARFSYLLVISRNSTRTLDGRSRDVRQIGQELGARFVLEGSVRRSGSRIRVSAQVVDAGTGTHLWAETFDRNLQDMDIFTVQDEIIDQVTATVADPYGVLIRAMAAPTGSRAPGTLTPYEAVLRFFLYQQAVTPSEHLAVLEALERVVVEQPDYADAWASLALCALDEYRHAFNCRPRSLERALESAQRAVRLDPANQLAAFALAQVHHFRHDAGAFRAAADRAIGLNPRDGNTMAMLGILTGYAGDWDRAVELTTRAMALNPHHPGWYRFATLFNAYRQGRYTEALEVVQKLNLPDYFPTHYTEAMTQAQLGRLEAAAAARERTLALWPDFERCFLTDHFEKWVPDQPELQALVIEGLEKAGFRLERRRRSDTSATPFG